MVSLNHLLVPNLLIVAAMKGADDDQRAALLSTETIGSMAFGTDSLISRIASIRGADWRPDATFAEPLQSLGFTWPDSMDNVEDSFEVGDIEVSTENHERAESPEQRRIFDNQDSHACISCGRDEGPALWLSASGGYSMFIDPMGLDRSSLPFALCGRCVVAAPDWMRASWTWFPHGAAWMPLGTCTGCGKNHELHLNELDNGSLEAETDNLLFLRRWWGRLGQVCEPHPLEPLGQARLCHECAHDWCSGHEYAEIIFEPARGHAHLSEFWDAHPEHVGWDHPERER